MFLDYEKPVKDIEVALVNLETILHKMKDKSNEEIQVSRDTLIEKLSTTNSQLSTVVQDVIVKDELDVKFSEERTQSLTWNFALIAAVAGFIIGFMLSAV